jgi:hypothetical protein
MLLQKVKGDLDVFWRPGFFYTVYSLAAYRVFRKPYPFTMMVLISGRQLSNLHAIIRLRGTCSIPMSI